MKKIINKAAINFFSCIARARGYKFSRVSNSAQALDADKVIGKDGYHLPPSLAQQMAAYKEGSVKFIAYHNNVPVGVVGLADPQVANRAFDLHGVNKDARHHEIQSLVVSKHHRDCSQIVLLGLFKEIYEYSICNAIDSWISLGMKQLYLTLRKYNKNISFLDLDTSSHRHSVAQHLYENNVFDSCAVMRVEDFQPDKILRRFLGKQVKKMQLKVRFFLAG